MENDDRKILFFRQPDPLERGVRLVCGGLLGLVVGGWSSFRWGFSWPVSIGLTVAAIAICAVGALKYGDDFCLGLFGK
jgi:hypothetical protein